MKKIIFHIIGNNHVDLQHELEYFKYVVDLEFIFKL